MAANSLREGMCVGALATMMALGGCAHTVVPPSEVERPSEIFLLDHGRTSSLVLPDGDALVRYAYGEWDWYVRNRTGVVHGSGALFVGSEAALGRRRVEADPNLAAVRAAVAVPVESAWAIEVPADEARALATELGRLFERRPHEPVENPRVALQFVPHPDAYSLGHNSNHVTASWLRRMECRVDTNGPLSRWRVLPPGTSG